MIEILESEKERLLSLLPQTDPTTEGYAILLNNLREIRWQIRDSQETPACSFRPVAVPSEVVINPVEPTPLAESVQADVVEDKQIITPELMEYDKAREKLTEAMSVGVKVKPVIRKYVANGEDPKLTNVPQEKYPDLLAEIDGLKKKKEAENAQ